MAVVDAVCSKNSGRTSIGLSTKRIINVVFLKKKKNNAKKEVNPKTVINCTYSVAPTKRYAERRKE